MCTFQETKRATFPGDGLPSCRLLPPNLRSAGGHPPQVCPSPDVLSASPQMCHQLHARKAPEPHGSFCFLCPPPATASHPSCQPPPLQQKAGGCFQKLLDSSPCQAPGFHLKKELLLRLLERLEMNVTSSASKEKRATISPSLQKGESPACTCGRGSQRSAPPVLSTEACARGGLLMQESQSCRLP